MVDTLLHTELQKSQEDAETDCFRYRSIDAFLKSRMGALGVLFALLLVYASLLPWNYRPLDWKETLSRWHEIKWLKLGVYHRADWIANGLVVLPSSFLLTGSLTYCTGRLPLTRLLVSFLSTIVVILLHIAIVFGIEFTQIWFPPRTVSMNDIFAGCLGALAGAVLWHLIGRLMVRFSLRFIELPTVKERVTILLYILCFISILHSAVPFDFITSWGELKQKVAMEKVRLLPSFDCFRDIWSWKGILNESLKVLPIALLVSINAIPRPYFLIFLITLVLEVLQIPIYSRHFDLNQVFFGALFGVVVYEMTRRESLWRSCVGSYRFWMSVTCFWTLFIFFAFVYKFDYVTFDPLELKERFRGFFLPPFARYYYTSEYRAGSSILGKSILFAILGMCLAMLRASRPAVRFFNPYLIASFFLIALSSMIEIVEIFLPPAFADVTDVFIATNGGLVGYWLCATVIGSSKQEESAWLVKMEPLKGWNRSP